MLVVADADRNTANSPGRILVVDDDHTVADLIADVLTDEGYDVAVRYDGAALPAALAEPPELVLLDVRMPGADGPEVCRRLKADPRTRDVPVVFVTATPHELLPSQLGGCQYEGVIHKPFYLAEMLSVVHQHLG
jgi:CheY-like chemotaxis protein